jgi:hypothetical protein
LALDPHNIAQTGIWDDPEAYDATYANCNEWGEATVGRNRASSSTASS